jgi:hypothetical protein
LLEKLQAVIGAEKLKQIVEAITKADSEVQKWQLQKKMKFEWKQYQ